LRSQPWKTAYLFHRNLPLSHQWNPGLLHTELADHFMEIRKREGTCRTGKEAICGQYAGNPP